MYHLTDRPTLVSCVIPVHNAETSLARAIESVLEQTHAPIEVVVVDDGSSDESPTVAQAYRRHRVFVVRQDRRGHSAAANHGMRLATGAFVALLEPDAVWHHRKLELQLRDFLTTPALGASTTCVRTLAPAQLAHGEQARPRLERPDVGTRSTWMARRDALVEVGPLDPRKHIGDVSDWLARMKHTRWSHRVLPDAVVERHLTGQGRDLRGVWAEREVLDIASGLLAGRRRTQAR